MTYKTHKFSIFFGIMFHIVCFFHFVFHSACTIFAMNFTK